MKWNSENKTQQIKRGGKIAETLDYFVDRASAAISDYFPYCNPYEVWIFQNIGNDFYKDICLAYFDFLDMQERFHLISRKNIKRLLSSTDEIEARTIDIVLNKMINKVKSWRFEKMSCIYLKSEETKRFFNNQLTTDCFVITTTTEGDLNVGDKLGSWVVTKKSDDGKRVVVKNNEAIPIPLTKWFWAKNENGLHLHWIHIPSYVDLDVAEVNELIEM